VRWPCRSAAGARGLSALGGLGSLQPLAVMFAGVAWPMPGIVHDLSIKFARTLVVSLVGLRRQPIGVQATGCSIACAGERHLERGARAGCANRGQGPCIQQGRLRLLAGEGIGGEQFSSVSRVADALPLANCARASPWSKAGSDENGPLTAAW